jgi:hypothetical protein
MKGNAPSGQSLAPLAFEMKAYPNAPHETQLSLRELRDTIRQFLLSNLGSQKPR